MAELTVPFIRSGVGATPADGGCVMQVADWIHRNKWTDAPPCVHPVIRRLAIAANDGLPDSERQKLLDLIPRMMGTASEDRVLDVRLAIVCAKAVLPLYEECHAGDERPRKAIEAARAWCECPSPGHAVAASAAAYAANAAYAAAAYAAAHAAAAVAVHAANAALVAPAAAARAIHELLIAVLDEYDLRTGRTKLEPVDFAPVAQMLAEAGV